MKRILFLSLGLLILVSGCVKKDETPVGEAHLRFVNAVSGSASQDVYVGSTSVNQLGLGYAQATPYTSVTSGINLVSFADKGTLVANAIINYNTEIGSYSSVYYYKNLTGTLVAGAIRDDMTEPPSGKARVRFVHLNNFLDNSLRVSAVGGAELFPALVFGSASAYFDVAPGTKFQAAATGVVTSPEINFNVLAGKIYTIVLTGSVATELYAFSLLQN
ncbi:DUF4397 domain-containing protein [Pedobacter sp. PWIIR3]